MRTRLSPGSRNISPRIGSPSEMQRLDAKTLRLMLTGLIRERSPLPVMRILFRRMGRLFHIPLPGFRATVTGGPRANRQVLVTGRDKLEWRSPDDPVTKLLRRGILVTDGEEHDRYQGIIQPLLNPGRLPGYTETMIRHTDRVSATWADGQVVDMLVESRRIALLIIMEALFSVDFWEDMPKLWAPILKAIAYISPGAWILIPGLPRPGYRKQIEILDRYLYGIIQDRRNAGPADDLLGQLIAAGLDDDRIRDQMLTLLIAGHDTTTALLAWAFYELGRNPDYYARLQRELDAALHDGAWAAGGSRQLPLLNALIKETLRLYPPIHMGSRRTAESIHIEDHCLPPGERLIYSIYLTHRDPDLWEEAEAFKPERFLGGSKVPPFAYLPFGGGPRACTGAAFGQAEGRIVLARLLQTHHFQLTNPRVHVHMGATLEPRPGVMMRVRRKI